MSSSFLFCHLHAIKGFRESFFFFELNVFKGFFVSEKCFLLVVSVSCPQRLFLVSPTTLKIFFVSSVSSMCLICQLDFSPQVSALSCRCYGFIACRFHKSKVLQMFVSKMDTICKLYCAWTVVVMIYFVWVRSYCLCKDECLLNGPYSAIVHQDIYWMTERSI